MAAANTIRSNKTTIQGILCGDYTLILDKVFEKEVITPREYNNLKNINNANVEKHVIELVDKIMNKGETKCRDFLDLLQTDEDITSTFPGLTNIQLNNPPVLARPVQVSAAHRDVVSQESKSQGKDDFYQLKSQPVGLCVIINNENFMCAKERRGTDKDAQSLAEVFSWLGFRVLIFKDQTRDQMDHTLKLFASLTDPVQLQGLSCEEWSGSGFVHAQPLLKHGDAFICCILSHGGEGVVLGIDKKPLPIKQITSTFEATDQSALTGKPKVFLIQACQGRDIQRGVLLHNEEADGPGLESIPVKSDFLVAYATVEGYGAFRNVIDGSWFIQSVCQELRERCPRGEDVTSILHHVNREVGRKEASRQIGGAKQMPEVRFTMRKKLVLSPHHN